MKYEITVLARGVATGVFLVKADSPVDEHGLPLHPPLYFLCWNGIACSATLHIDLLMAVAELVALEDAADAEERNPAGQVSLPQDEAAPQTIGPAHAAVRQFMADWGRIPAMDWDALANIKPDSPAVRKAMSRDAQNAQHLLGYADKALRILMDESLSPDAVMATWRKNADDVVRDIEGTASLKTGFKHTH